MRRNIIKPRPSIRPQWIPTNWLLKNQSLTKLQKKQPTTWPTTTSQFKQPSKNPSWTSCLGTDLFFHDPWHRYHNQFPPSSSLTSVVLMEETNKEDKLWKIAATHCDHWGYQAPHNSKNVPANHLTSVKVPPQIHCGTPKSDGQGSRAEGGSTRKRNGKTWNEEKTLPWAKDTLRGLENLEYVKDSWKIEEERGECSKMIPHKNPET